MTDAESFKMDQGATTWAKVDQAVGTNTIPHHAAVETAEDGAKNGRHFYTSVNAVTVVGA
jgi:hypothetical protein